MPDVGASIRLPQPSRRDAVLPIPSYDQWWNNQIKSRVLNQIPKSEK